MKPIFCKIIRSTLLFSAFAASALVTFNHGNAQETIDLNVDFSKGQHHQVKVQIHHIGDVVIDDFQSESGEQKVLPLNVDAKLKYAQRFTGSDKNVQSIRYYQKPTSAKIKIKSETSKSELADSNHWIIARLKDKQNQLQMASIADVLSQSETELIKNAGDPLTFPALLNKKGIRVNDKWSVTNGALASFLAVDRVYDNEVQLSLKEFNDEIAKVYIMGSVKAEVDDVATEMELSGIVIIQYKKGFVSALRTNIREMRDAGQIAPGFEGQTKIDLRIEPIKSVSALTNKRLGKLTKSMKIEHRLKLQPEGGLFKIIYDPRWRVIASEDEAAVLRYINDGDLLAQCNIVQLSPVSADRPVSMEQFKTEVQKIIKKDEVAKIAGFNQSTTPNGLSALKVVVEGLEKGVPVNWIYYHVSAKDGRRLTFVFTLEKEIANLFAPADEALINEVVFLPPQSKAQKRSASNATSRRTRK